jgi:hypothetical protein
MIRPEGAPSGDPLTAVAALQVLVTPAQAIT